MKCLNCNEPFTQLTVTQKYCCDSCKRAYYRKTTKEQRRKMYPETSFNCAECGALVITDNSERLDMRTKFCSQKCEKKFWKHSDRIEKKSQLTRFGSLSSYLRYEKWSNENF